MAVRSTSNLTEGRSMGIQEPFCWSGRVQYNHTDAQGRVFYANYFGLLDQARCAFWEAIGLPEGEVIQIEHDTVIVHLAADYHGPAAFYDTLSITVEPQKLGRSSLHLLYRVQQAVHKRDVLTAQMVMVQVDLASERSRAWAPTFRSALLHHTGPHITQTSN